MARIHPVVSTQWALDNLSTPGVVVVEVDEDTSAYDRGHLHGATSINWQTELQDDTRRGVINRERFGLLLGSKGISSSDTVVLYGDNHNWFAAYAYWCFKLYGHDDVRLIDGGRTRLEKDDHQWSTEVPHRRTVVYNAAEPNHSLRAMRHEVLAAVFADENTTLFIDVRTVDEFRGRLAAPAHLPQERGQTRGHIPGAVNITWDQATNNDGTFKDPEELAKIYALALNPEIKDVIAYCRIGERSSLTWFVLHELLGLDSVRNYDGSWVEYGSLIDVPVDR